MTLDRKDYKSAIPQLEKRISQIEQVGEKGLANFDVLKASLEKEIRVRTQALLKTNERVEYAITSADGKNTIYHSASKPTGGEYKGGDTWFDASHGYAIYTWDENVSDWVKEELGEDAIANLAITNAKIANGTIQSAKIGTLDAGKITSGDIASARLQTNVVSAINATVNQIDAKNINVDGTLIVGASDVASAIDNIDVGGRNLLRGTATLANGNSGWSSGHWRASGTGGTIAYAQTITNPPVTGVKGITITPTSANTQVGFVQDSVPLSKREITQSVWVKGKSGDKIDLQPIWSGTPSQEEYGSQRYTLEDSNWHKLTYTKTPNYDHSSVSAGYVYLYAVDTSGARQFIAPQLEYGNKCSDWSTAKEDVDADISSASKVATNYLTTISGTTGISVHNASDTNNFANFNSDGMTVYKGGTPVAKFADAVTVGKTNSINAVIDSGGMAIKNVSTNLATFKYRAVESWSGETGTTIESASAIGIYPNSSYSANKGLVMSYANGGDVIFFFNDRLQFTPNPIIVAKSKNANISLTANTITKVPLTYIDFEQTNNLDGETTLMSINSGSVVFDELDGCSVEVTASVYILPTASTPAHIFLYYYNGSDGTTTEVGAGATYLTSYGGAVQLCSRVITPIFGGDNDKLYVSVRCASASGTVYCNNKDTFLTVKYL